MSVPAKVWRGARVRDIEPRHVEESNTTNVVLEDMGMAFSDALLRDPRTCAMMHRRPT